MNDYSQNLETAALLALLRASGTRWQQIADDVLDDRIDAAGPRVYVVDEPEQIPETIQRLTSAVLLTP